MLVARVRNCSGPNGRELCPKSLRDPQPQRSKGSHPITPIVTIAVSATRRVIALVSIYQRKAISLSLRLLTNDETILLAVRISA